eukprot:2995640-Alexandrium_andersonii.AAC.1
MHLRQQAYIRNLPSRTRVRRAHIRNVTRAASDTPAQIPDLPAGARVELACNRESPTSQNPARNLPRR